MHWSKTFAAEYHYLKQRNLKFFNVFLISAILITRVAVASDKAYQLLAHGRCFSPGTPASSTTKTGRHDIAEILLKVALKHKPPQKTNFFIPIQLSILFQWHSKVV
jgi:hypothetical protein